MEPSARGLQLALSHRAFETFAVTLGTEITQPLKAILIVDGQTSFTLPVPLALAYAGPFALLVTDGVVGTVKGLIKIGTSRNLFMKWHITPRRAADLTGFGGEGNQQHADTNN